MNGKVALFKETRTYDQSAKRHMHYQTAICSRCGAFENHPIKASRPLPPEPLIKLFQRRGWVMGNTRAHDICPACIKDAAKAKRQEAEFRRNRFLSGTAHAPPEAGVHPNVPVPITPQETASIAQIIALKETPRMLKAVENPPPAPRQPTREEKRLIIMAIEERYLGPDKGYDTGHTDETVAKSMNVPAKWVADLREEFFGPLVNPEIGKLNGEVASLLARLDTHEREGREIRAKLNDIKERLSKAVGVNR